MKKLLLLFILIITLYSCEKEETFSKGELLINSWMLDETLKDGEAFFNDPIYLKNSTYTFYKDNTMEFKISQSSDIILGAWQFDEVENKLIISLPDVISEFDLIKINDSTLWISSKLSDTTYIYKYRSSDFDYN